MLCDACYAEIYFGRKFPSEVNPATGVVSSTGMKLGKTHIEILSMLYSRQNQYLSRETLFHVGWGDKKLYRPSKDVHVAINAIRNRTGFLIANDKKRGWKLIVDSEGNPVHGP